MCVCVCVCVCVCGGGRAERWPNHLSLWGDTGGIQAGKVCNVASTNSTSEYSLWHLAVQTFCQSYFYSPTFNIYLSHLAQYHTIVIVIVYMMNDDDPETVETICWALTDALQTQCNETSGRAGFLGMWVRIFNFSAPSSSLCLSLWKIPQPLQLPGVVG